MATTTPRTQPSAPPSASSQIKGDMRVNNLIYKQPDSLSLAVNRTMKRQKFQQNSYSDGETAIINFNTGSDYMKNCNSYLTFELTLTGTTPTANFGIGSAVNLFESILITTRSGSELDRTESLNLHSAKTLRQKNSQDWIDNFGSMMGMGSTGIAGTDAANTSATATKFVIPLSKLSGVFDPVGGLLLPPQLAAGMEIRLTCADFRTALFQKAGTVTGYTISNISIMADLVSMSDSTQKSLNFESATNGLEYTYPRWHTAKTTGTSTDINVQISKSVAQASMLYAVLVKQADVLDVTTDSFASEAWDITSWSTRVGSLYQPNEPLKDTAKDALESYFISQAVYDKARYNHAENSVSLVDFKTNGSAVICSSFERDQALNLSGTAINNSRQVEVNITLDSWAYNLEVSVFLEYHSVCRAFMDNASIAV